MDIKIFKVKQFSSTYKKVIVVDNIPVAISRGNETASEIIAYIQGYSSELKDGKLRRDIDKFLEQKGDKNE